MVAFSVDSLLGKKYLLGTHNFIVVTNYWVFLSRFILYSLQLKGKDAFYFFIFYFFLVLTSEFLI